MGKPERPPVFGRPEQPNSLFGEILDWMLAPLVLVWPISIAATHHVANDIADHPYDQALAERVTAVARLVHIVDGRIQAELPAAARTVLSADEHDDIWYQVRDSSGGLLAGDDHVPAPSGDNEPVLEEVRYRDELVAGEPIRIAYQLHKLQPDKAWVVIQVAETRKKRQALTSRIISGVLLPQFAIIPLAVMLVWLGLSRGLAPVNRLRETVSERRPGDLSPVNLRRVPEELQPMVLSFNEMMARLEENLQAQQRFIADAAHQMRTPIAGLKAQADLALSESDPEQLRRSVEQIALSAERTAHLISQLLTLARAESSHDKIHRFETVDMDALARDVASDWVMRAHTKGIDFGFEAAGWPQLVEGVPLLLRELLSNLVDNAVKYTPAGNPVTLRVLSGDYVVVEVEDSGIGIPPEDRERVFERFYRVLGTGVDGSGLGLPICREIADLHRAAIDIHGGSGGHGTRVSVVFPRSAHGRFIDEARRVADIDPDGA